MTNFVCLVLMVNLSAPLVINSGSDIAPVGPGTLLCANGGYRWISFSDLDVEKQKPNSAFKCVICFFEQDDVAALCPTASIPSVNQGKDNAVATVALSPLARGFDFYSTRAPPKV